MQDAHIYLVILIISLNYAIIFKSHLGFVYLLGGRFARPVTSLSFKRKKKKSFLKNLVKRGRIEHEELVNDSGKLLVAE